MYLVSFHHCKSLCLLSIHFRLHQLNIFDLLMFIVLLCSSPVPAASRLETPCPITESRGWWKRMRSCRRCQLSTCRAMRWSSINNSERPPASTKRPSCCWKQSSPEWAKGKKDRIEGGTEWCAGLWILTFSQDFRYLGHATPSLFQWDIPVFLFCSSSLCPWLEAIEWEDWQRKDEREGCGLSRMRGGC